MASWESRYLSVGNLCFFEGFQLPCLITRGPEGNKKWDGIKFQRKSWPSFLASLCTRHVMLMCARPQRVSSRNWIIDPELKHDNNSKKKHVPKRSNKSMPAGSSSIVISLTLPTFDATSQPVVCSHPLSTSPRQAVFALRPWWTLSFHQPCWRSLNDPHEAPNASSWILDFGEKSNS